MPDLKPAFERFRIVNDGLDYQKGLNVALRKALELYASPARPGFVVSEEDEFGDAAC